MVHGKTTERRVVIACVRGGRPEVCREAPDWPLLNELGPQAAITARCAGPLEWSVPQPTVKPVRPYSFPSGICASGTRTKNFG
jgi:hypothetical protein